MKNLTVPRLSNCGAYFISRQQMKHGDLSQTRNVVNQAFCQFLCVTCSMRQSSVRTLTFCISERNQVCCFDFEMHSDKARSLRIGAKQNLDFLSREKSSRTNSAEMMHKWSSSFHPVRYRLNSTGRVYHPQ